MDENNIKNNEIKKNDTLKILIYKKLTLPLQSLRGERVLASKRLPITPRKEKELFENKYKKVLVSVSKDCLPLHSLLREAREVNDFFN